MANELDWDWGKLASACRAEIRRVLRDGPEAEDAVQEALARAWRRRHTCRTPTAPTAWIRAIARNEALRAIGRRRLEPSLDEEPHLAARETSDATEKLAERAAVRTALKALEPQDRVLLALRYEQDLTQPRIASMLGLPEGTVKVRLHRIRARLVPALSDTQ